MSIWSTRVVVGEGDDIRPDGSVQAYRAGWSNWYPMGDDPAATVDTAHIPAWCVPGHKDAEGCRHDGIGQWLRLGIDSPDAQSWWGKDPDKRPEPAPVHASVVLTEDAVRRLRDDLTDWLDAAKVRPE